MGGPGVYKPEFPTLPSELQNARTDVWSQIQNRMQQPSPSYQAAGGQLYAQTPQYLTNAGAQMNWLLGGGGSPSYGMQAGQGSGYPMPKTGIPPQQQGLSGTGGGETGGGFYPQNNIPEVYGSPPGYGTPSVQGGNMPMPNIFGNVESTLGGMMATGNPVNMSPAYQAMKQQALQSIQDETNRAMQGAHMTGTRYGTIGANAAAQAAQRGMTNFQAQVMPMEMQEQSAAQNRMLQAAQQGLSLGQVQSQIPLDRILAASQMGLGQQQLGQQQATLGYQDWLSRLPQNSPYWANAMTYAMGYPSNASAPTVTQPWWSQLLGGFGAAGGAAGAKALGLA